MDHSSSSFTESKALDQGSTSFISAKPHPSEPYFFSHRDQIVGEADQQYGRRLRTEAFT
jgi:hypothetical protein